MDNFSSGLLVRFKMVSLLFFLTVMFPLLGSAQTKPRVIATTSFIADLAQNIAGEYADVESP